MSVFIRLAKSVKMSDYSYAKQLKYIAGGAAAIAEDSTELSTWADGIEKSARQALVSQDLDEQSLLIIESLVAEFKAKLDEIVDFAAEFLLDEDFDEDFDEGFYDAESEKLSLEELVAIVDELIANEDDADLEENEFWSIIDANFDPDFDEHVLQENGVSSGCECASCTAAADAEGVKLTLSNRTDIVADSIKTLAREAYLVLNDKFRHPAMRNDQTVETYAAKWCEEFKQAAIDGPYALADVLVRLSSVTDDALFALIAKNAPTVDSFATRTVACFGEARTLLAQV